jgi:hypothetical protein
LLDLGAEFLLRVAHDIDTKIFEAPLHVGKFQGPLRSRGEAGPGSPSA